jgi:CDK inhibitor PHO81
LTHGVDPTRLDVYGRVPLHYACLKGRIPMLEKLIAAAPTTIDMKDHDNFTPLIHSIVHNRVECVRLLLAHNAQIEPGSDADHIPLNLACQHGSIEVVSLLLAKQPAFLPDAEGLFPQHLVARSSPTADLLLLLQQRGADLNQRDKLYAWTPLFHAASEGRVECLRALLSYGADPDALDEKGLSATYYATWEGHLTCVDLLWENQKRKASSKSATTKENGLIPQLLSGSATAMDVTPPELGGEPDGIPDLSLPPPIIPMRRYGHNFLDSKSFIAINFDRGAKAIQFFNEARYPAARLTVSSKTSDLIPRNVMLPIQEDSRSVVFQADTLSTFTVDFEIFPTFGSKVIAKSVALPDMFKEGSSGIACIPLFDPRLRAVGQIHFNYQVIQPYSGRPLEITQFATYWKATSALDESGLITGSSLSGDYLRLCVQLTRDAVPVIYSAYTFDHSGLDVSISSLPFRALPLLSSDTAALRHAPETTNVVEWRSRLSNSILSLKDVLASLPASINLNLHVLYPTQAEQEYSGVYNNFDINTFADAILTEVFDHARALRAQSTELTRSIVFTTWNQDVCTALNWKQPNFPVLLCNGLGAQPNHGEVVNSFSIKEAVRLAQSNNFMGIICSARILTMVPALIETIKQAGLVLVSDSSSQQMENVSNSTRAVLPEGVNGLLKANGVLRFNESVDM